MTVINLHPTKPNPEIVKKIEDLLVRAKKGEITSILYVVGGKEGYSNHWWDGSLSAFETIGALEILKHDVVRHTLSLGTISPPPKGA